MSFLRRAQPLRKIAFSPVLVQRASRSHPTIRGFTTESPPPPPPKSNTALYAGIGAAAVGGLAICYFTDFGKEAGTAVKSATQSAKSAAGFVPKQEDYQKVCVFVFLTGFWVYEILLATRYTTG
jgi:cytochrome c peroxidase